MSRPKLVSKRILPILKSRISFLTLKPSSLDRCVSKYLEGQQLVGVVLQKANEAQQQQQQQMMQMQQQMGG